MSCSRRVRRAVLAAAGVTLLLAGPASAHPFIQGGEAPVDSLAELTLSMAHGCASEVAGAGDPTTEIALEVPDWMRIVEVPATDGWDVTLEPDDVEVEVVTWSNPEAEAPAPAVTFDAVVSGEPGAERYLAVFQGCADDSYRWIGTPDAPADDPAVRLQLVAADPDRPAPPATDPAGDAAGASDPADEPDDSTDGSSGDSTDDSTDDVAASDDPADDGATDADVPDDPAGDPVDEAPEALVDPEPDGPEGFSTTPIIIAVIVLVLGGIGGVVAMRRRDGEA